MNLDDAIIISAQNAGWDVDRVVGHETSEAEVSWSGSPIETTDMQTVIRLSKPSEDDGFIFVVNPEGEWMVFSSSPKFAGIVQAGFEAWSGEEDEDD